ncbi:MAG: hypothetical protein H7333_07280, partial [Bdellovibrionales bacterium]|nr:hypothetical protein [Oligoflexia bacterium]
MSDDQRIHRQTFNDSKENREEALPTPELGHGQGGSVPSKQEKRLKTALVHDWLNGMRGGEIVFEAILDLHPEADVFTLVYEPEKLSPLLREKLSKRQVYASFLNRFQLTREKYRQLLPLLPFAIRTLDLY